MTPPEAFFWGVANAPPLPSQGGQNRVLPLPNIGEKFDKKVDNFSKNSFFQKFCAPPPNDFTHLRLYPPSNKNHSDSKYDTNIYIIQQINSIPKYSKML